MGTTKFTYAVKELVIKLRLEGKTIPEITKITGMGKPSQQKLYREHDIKLSPDHLKANVTGARWKNHEPIKDGKKYCSGCNIEKDISEFHKAKRRLSGLTSKCKSCERQNYANNSDKKIEAVRRYKANNPEAVKASAKKYYGKHVEDYKTYAVKWTKENPEKVKESTRRYAKKTQPQKNARTAAYRAAKIRATPSWLTDQHYETMENFYLHCPIGCHVDHIVPLRGENVSGLHVPWNLQWLDGVENMSKGNKHK